MMAVYGYVRVSTVRQADEGKSLDVQQRTIAGYALMHGMVVDQVFIERAISGSVPFGERPQGAALIGLVQKGDAIITPTLDRMFRSALDGLGVLRTLREQGTALHMIDLGGDVATNGISKLVFTILSAVAEAERDRTRERVAEVKRDQRARGRYLGGIVPYGYRVVPSGADRALVPVPEQQAVIARIRELRAAGKPLRAIRSAIADGGAVLSIDAINRVCRDAGAVAA